MRYTILSFFVASTIVCGQTSAGPQTTKTAKIEEMFRLTKADQMQTQMMAQMSAMMKVPDTDSSRQIMEFISQKMGWDSMKPELIKLYDETYTEDEISGILMFYHSAPGQALLAKTPTLMANTMLLVQKRMAEMKPELDKMIKQAAEK